MADARQPGTSLSGLTESEAQEFHKIFMTSFFIFTAIAFVAHILVWMWWPWLPGEEGYASVIEGVNGVVSSVAPYLA